MASSFGIEPEKQMIQRIICSANAHHVRSPLDFAVETLNGICGVELDAMLLGKAHVGQNVVLCFIHNGRELGYLRTDQRGAGT